LDKIGCFFNKPNDMTGYVIMPLVSVEVPPHVIILTSKSQTNWMP